MPKPRVQLRVVAGQGESGGTPLAGPNEAFVWTDLAKQIIDCDQNAEHLFGYSTEALKGQDLQVLFYGPVPEVGAGTHKLRSKTGHILTASVTLSTVRDGKKKATGFVVHFTEIVSYGNEEPQYEKVANNFPVAVFVLQNGRLQYTNSQFQTELGYTDEELAQLAPLELVHPDDVPIVKEAVAACLHGEDPYTCEFRAITRTGEVKQGYGRITGISHQGSPAILGSYVLIDEGQSAEQELRARQNEIQVYALELEAANAELRESQQQLMESNRRLRESEAKYRSLAENANDILYALDCDGTVTYAGPSVARYGWNPDEVIGRSFLEFISEEDREQLVRDFVQTIENDEGWPSCFRLMDAQGNAHWMEDHSKVQRDEAGKTIGLTGVLRDITERKNWEKEIQAKHHQVQVYAYELEAANEELRQAQRQLIEINEKLREGEEKFRTIFEYATDEILYLDETGTIIDVNGRVEEIFGYKPDEIIGENFAELGWMTAKGDMTDLAERFHRWVKKGREGQAIIEMEARHRDGRPVFLEASIRLLTQEGLNGRLLAIIRDVTDRKLTEDAIRRSERRFRSLIENAPDMILITDTEGKILYGSPSIERIHGWPLEELIGRDGYSFVHPDDLARVPLPGPDGTRSPEFIELRVRHKNGSWRWVEMTLTNLLDDPTVNGYVANYRDITERKHAEEALKESEEKYRTIIENIQDVYYRTDLDGKLLMISASGLRILGCESEASVIGEDFNRTFFADEEERDAFFKALEESGEVYNYEVTLRKLDGSPVYVLASSHFFYDKQGNQAGVEGVFTDITERKQAQEEQRKLMISLEEQNQIIIQSHLELEDTLEKLEKAHEDLKNSQEQLLQSEKLAAIGELVSGVAHEVNNPLMAIAGHAELLLEDVVDEAMQRPLAMISSEADRAIDIVQNLLSFARKQRSEKSLISINEGITSTVKLRSYELALDNIHVAMNFDPELPKIRADAQQLKQVFLNLVNNAAFEMSEAHDQGELTITTERIDDDQIRITFADDGPGIDPDILDRVFEPFFTTKDIGKGTGLGLSICYGIIRDHNGSIYARNRDTGGAMFVIELPIDPE